MLPAGDASMKGVPAALRLSRLALCDMLPAMSLLLHRALNAVPAQPCLLLRSLSRCPFCAMSPDIYLSPCYVLYAMPAVFSLSRCVFCDMLSGMLLSLCCALYAVPVELYRQC